MIPTIEQVIEKLQESDNLEQCSHYGEPGYGPADTGILFCNWNDVEQNVQDYLEQAGYTLEWSDEWYIDYNNDKAYRTQPDCYGWESRILITGNGEVLTPDDDAEEWINEVCLTDWNHPIKALPSWVGVYAEWTKVNDDSYESGFHYGQNDDPQTIAKKLFSAGAESVLFQINESSQFYIKFDVYVMGELV